MVWGGAVAQQKSTGGDEVALKALEEKWDMANLKGDTATLSAIFVDTFISTSSEGKVRTKAEILAQLKSGEVKYETSKMDDMKVFVYGDWLQLAHRGWLQLIKDAVVDRLAGHSRLNCVEKSLNVESDTVTPAAPPTEITSYFQQALQYVHAAWSANTWRAYRSDWEDFSRFCQTHGRAHLPASAETLALYLTYLVDTRHLKTATLERRMAAISQAHRAAGHLSPTEEALVRTVMKGIRGVHGSAQTPKHPLSPLTLRTVFSKRPSGLRGLRDRALVLIGFAGALRRSELASLTFDDVEFVAEGLVLTIRRSKTDQEGAGEQIGIPHGRHALTCPVRALEDWLNASGVSGGRLFRALSRKGVLGQGFGGHRVARIVKRIAAAAGLDPSQFAGHSLRSGLATAAAANGATERAIMDQTRHKSVKTVRRYIRRGSLFRENAAGKSGL